MGGKINLDDYKKIISDYDVENNKEYSLDEILEQADKSEISYNSEKSEKTKSTVIENEVNKPDGISITGAFEAVYSEKNSAKTHEPVLNDDINNDAPVKSINEEKQSFEITSDIEQKRFFDTETFESIKNKDPENFRSTMITFAKGAQEEQDDEMDEDHFTPHQPTEEIEDFEQPDERDDIILDLQKINASASFKSIFTFVLACVSATLFLISRLNISLPGLELGNNPRLYLTVLLSISVLGTIVNINTIINGISAIARFKFNPNTFLILVFIFGTIVDLNSIIYNNQVAVSFDLIYMIMLWINIMSKHIISKNILKNFKVVSSDGQKTVVDKPVSEEISNDIILETGAGGDIIYASKSKFVTEFIHNSFKDFEMCEQSSPLYTFFVFAVIAFSIVILVMKSSLINSFVYAAGAICAITPFLNVFSFAAPLAINSRRVRKSGGVIAGGISAFELRDTQTLIVDDSDVFTVALNGIRLYGEALIDDAIIYLNALYKAVGGPLETLFNNMLSENIVSLPRIDDIYYHDGMGYSALIHSKVFVAGNKELMNHFGIEIDDSEFEIIYQKKSKNVLFVAYDGKLMSIFILSYKFSHGVRTAFELCDADQINVAVIQRDANINSEMLFANFDPTDKSLFKVMNFRTSRNCFDKFSIRTKTPSILASNTGLKGVAAALHGCKSFLFAAKANNAIKTISSIIGFALITFLLMFSDPGSALQRHILLYQFLWSLPILFVTVFSK